MNRPVKKPDQFKSLAEWFGAAGGELCDWPGCGSFIKATPPARIFHQRRCHGGRQK